MTLTEIQSAIASMLTNNGGPITPSDLTVNGQNLALVALNNVRRNAEFNNDLNFQRQVLTLTVDFVTGAALSGAVVQGTATTVNIKTILEMGVFDASGNLIPIQWTTTEASQEQTRSENQYHVPRYLTDGQACHWTFGEYRLMLRNGYVYVYPQNNQRADYSLNIWLECYTFANDWTTAGDTVVVSGTTGITGANGTYYRYGIWNNCPLYLSVANGSPASNLCALFNTGTQWWLTAITWLGYGGTPTAYFFSVSTNQRPDSSIVGYTASGGAGGTIVVTSANTDSTSDIWTTKGSEYLIWASVVWLNWRFKNFVPRTEGNLPPPQQMATDALAALVDWDIYMFEGHRRHGRQ